MPRPVGINHVAVEVGSIDEAIAFFEQLFGEVELRGRNPSMAFVDLGDQFIALSASRSQPPDGDRANRCKSWQSVSSWPPYSSIMPSSWTTAFFTWRTDSIFSACRRPWHCSFF